MKTTIFKPHLLLLIILSIISCKTNTFEPEEEDQLPPITQNGANTFGCLINGEVFIPKDKKGYTPPGGGTPRGISIWGNSTTFIIEARNYIDTYLYIYIPQDLPEEGVYAFGNSPGVGFHLNSPNYPHMYCVINGKKYLSFVNSSNITFTKVIQNSGIYAGTFSIKLKNENDPNDTIEITEGRFDINLITLDD